MGVLDKGKSWQFRQTSSRTDTFDNDLKNIYLPGKLSRGAHSFWRGGFIASINEFF